MRWKIIAAAAIVVVLIIVAAPIIAFNLLDYNQFKGDLAAAVADATGRRLAIDGDVTAGGVLKPHVAIEGVRFANPDWAAGPEMVALRRAELELDVLALLGGVYEIRRLVLIEPVLALETAADGRTNWTFDRTAPEQPSDRPVRVPRLMFDDVRIERARFSYTSAETGRTERVALDHLVADQVSASAPLSLFGALHINDQPVTLTGRFDGPAALAAGRRSRVDLTLTAGGARLTVDGELPAVGAPADVAAEQSLDLSVAVTGPGFAPLARFAAALTHKPISVPDLGPYRVDAHVVGPPDRLTAPSVSLDLGGAETLAVRVAGTAGALQSGDGADLTLHVEANDLGPLASLFGGRAPPLPPTTVAARLTGQDRRITLDELDLVAGRSRVMGKISVRPDTTPPQVSIDLASPMIDLAELMPARPADAAPGAAQPGTAADPPAPPPTTTGARRLFPDVDLPLAALRTLNADFALAAETVVAGDARLGNVELRGIVRSGILHLTRAAGAVAGGDLQASMTVDARDDALTSLHTGLTIEGIDLGTVLHEAAANDTITGAPIDLNLSLVGTGATVRSVMAGLSGDVLLEVGEGRLANAYIDLLGADLLSEAVSFLNPFDSEPEGANLNCLVAGLVFRGGKAIIDRSVAFETDKTAMVIGGEVDLGAETLDLAVRTESRGGFTISAGMLSRLIRVTGTLASPSIGIDTGGVARAAASVAAAVATGGWSLLAEAVYDAATRDDTPCKTALVQAKTALFAASQETPY